MRVVGTVHSGIYTAMMRSGYLYKVDYQSSFNYQGFLKA
jgi:hypothetical protein